MEIKFTSTKKDKPDKLRIGICAPSGYGKTYLLRTIPYQKEAEVLVITSEKGNTVLRDKNYQEYALEQNNIYKELFNVLKHLYTDESKQFKWVCLDSMTDIAEKFLAHMQKNPDPYKTKTGAIDTRAMYGDLKKQIIRIMDGFLGIPYGHKICIFGAIEENEGVDRKLKLNMPGSAKDVIMFNFDEFYHIKIQQDEEKGTVRQLVTCNDGYYEAKSRMSAVSPLEVYEECDLTHIISKCYWEKEKENDQ